MTILGRAFHGRRQRETTIPRALQGFAAGAIVVAVLLLLYAGPKEVISPVTFLQGWAVIGLLLVLSTPGWLLLHAFGARCQVAAIIYGSSFGFMLVMMAPLLSMYGWFGLLVGDFSLFRTLFPIAIKTAVAGGLIGWVMAKVAYTPASSAA